MACCASHVTNHVVFDDEPCLQYMVRINRGAVATGRRIHNKSQVFFFERLNVPLLPPVFSINMMSEMTISLSTALHMS